MKYLLCDILNTNTVQCKLFLFSLILKKFVDDLIFVLGISVVKNCRDTHLKTKSLHMIIPPLFILLQGTGDILQSKEGTPQRKHLMIDMIEDHRRKDLLKEIHMIEDLLRKDHQIEMVMIDLLREEPLILMIMVEDPLKEMIMIEDPLKEMIMIEDLQRRVVMIEDTLKNNLPIEENMTEDPQTAMMKEDHLTIGHQKEDPPHPSLLIVMKEDPHLQNHLTAMIGNQHPTGLLKGGTQEDSQVNASPQVPHSSQILVV